MSGTNRERPPPVSAHVFTKYDDRHVLCYGGRTEDGWCNTTWIFDLEKKVICKYYMYWGGGASWP